MYPTVSVVMTCYNYGKYVGQSIESVLMQTYKDFELIIINDGSTDNSDSIIKCYTKDRRIHYIMQDNAGQARAKNAGIKLSCGKYIAFLDADDLWEKEKIEMQLPLFMRNETGVVYSNAIWIDDESREIGRGWGSGYFRPRSQKVSNYLLYDNFIYFSSAIVRKECFDKVGIFDESLTMGIDWDLWLRMSVHYEFDYVDKHLIKYRWGHIGQMSKNKIDRLRCSFTILQRFLESNSHRFKKSEINGALAYAYCNRGNFYKAANRKLSNEYFILAIKQLPTYYPAWIGMFKNMVHLRLS